MECSLAAGRAAGEQALHHGLEDLDGQGVVVGIEEGLVPALAEAVVEVRVIPVALRVRGALHSPTPSSASTHYFECLTTIRPIAKDGEVVVEGRDATDPQTLHHGKAGPIDD